MDYDEIAERIIDEVFSFYSDEDFVEDRAKHYRMKEDIVAILSNLDE